MYKEDNIDIHNIISKKKKTKSKIILYNDWSNEQEQLLVEWSEKAQCYRWLHTNSERKYRKGNFYFTIPVIIMSTLTGTANFAVESYIPKEHQDIAKIAIGSVNILAGILSTLQNFLKYAECNEAHRNAGIAWSKFSRNIKIELSLHRIRRKNASDFLKIYRAEYNRLIEQNPLIPDEIIKEFKKHYKKNSHIDFYQPDICSGLEKCHIINDSE
jgi:hypothetical protein